MINQIPKFNPNPKSYTFIFHPIFELFEKNVPPKIISDYIEELFKFIDDLDNKTEIIITNCNELFDVYFTLKINQQQEIKCLGDKLEKIMKDALQDHSIKSPNTFNSDIEKFYNKIIDKIKPLEVISVNFTIVWVEKLIELNFNDKIKYLEKILPYIIQFLKNRIVINDAQRCFNLLKKKIEENYLEYYRKYKEILERIFTIIIQEFSVNNNEVNIMLLDFINLIIGKSLEYIKYYLSSSGKKIDNNQVKK